MFYLDDRVPCRPPARAILYPWILLEHGYITQAYAVPHVYLGGEFQSHDNSCIDRIFYVMKTTLNFIAYGKSKRHCGVQFAIYPDHEIHESAVQFHAVNSRS